MTLAAGITLVNVITCRAAVMLVRSADALPRPPQVIATSEREAVDRDMTSHATAAASSVRPYHGASGNVIGRIAGSVTPARRYSAT